MSEHEQLLAALHQQTQAMRALTQAVSELAQSNRDMIDYLAHQQGEGDDQEPTTYLDGTPVVGRR
ncbi:hypothetical protein [Pseudomonas typographi]|uniref:hypothetical protein n=1 Tax=Pseudomonas typographi TaxID=2715964 RepID=UPI0016839990|nr:hypothetical protein [Pseudomonas typographi]MBD1553622.1 hypothetical protein [Pseudomonas typographi]